MKSDIMRQINDDLNILVSEAHAELSRGFPNGPSPVLTGFFASHWKADTKYIRTTDDKEGTQWDLPTTKDSMGRTVLKNASPIFDPQFPVTKRFILDQNIYIGNTAFYTAIALGPPGAPNFGSRNNGIPLFIQGTLGQLINETFKEKRPKMKIASGQSVGLFGTAVRDKRRESEPGFMPGVSYESL